MASLQNFIINTPTHPKIHFSIRKNVKFGQALYVCGNTHKTGNWNPSRAHRLTWNQSDIWVGSLALEEDTPFIIHFKYLVADYDYPSLQNSEWEVGKHNRQAQVPSKSVILCDDKWNMDRISLQLVVKKSKAGYEEKYYVVGDITELGSWRQKKTMKKVNKRNITFHHLKKQNYGSDRRIQEKEEIYQYSFYMFRARQKISYYYIKKGQVFQSQRKPGRLLIFNQQQNGHPFRRQVAHLRGEITITDECNINELVISNITNNICVGSYLKSASDIAKLSEQNITAILSIQSEQDFFSHGLSPHYLQLLCEENGVNYRSYAIEDMNATDFVDKAYGAVKMMNDLMQDSGKIYVHCSAGIYRSPQLIALYLATFQNYTVEEAVSLVKERHPYAKPNLHVVSKAMELVRGRTTTEKNSS